nr:MAG TPA: hypothetical protein [Caudoviricetes sp.]
MSSSSPAGGGRGWGFPGCAPCCVWGVLLFGV